VPVLRLPDDKAAVPVARRRWEPRRRHGGAWKVAYADFVTAMMALFIVLWLVNSSKLVKASVTGYFRDPRGYTRKLGAGPSSHGEGLPATERNVRDLQHQLEQALRRAPDIQKILPNVSFSVTGEGLRIDLMEAEQGTFFVAGSPSPTAAGEGMIRLLASELARLPNDISIEGHTDSRPFRNAGAASGYGNWELSTDRAHVARRLLQQDGLPAGRVVEVRGCADRRLLAGAASDDPRNRRVSVVVRFQGE
jgi:chemotaxis protein MotB